VGYALSRITVNPFCVGAFIKIEDREGGSPYMLCCTCVSIYGKHTQVLQMEEKNAIVLDVNSTHSLMFVVVL
jgi:hypothetical protein